MCDRRSIFTARTGPGHSIRNVLRCRRCHASARNRHVALLARRHLGIRALRDLRDSPGPPHILNASATSPLAAALGEAAYNTEFWSDVTPGASRDGIRCEDLTTLSFADASLDLVISEDVLEHVPDVDRALEETRRVLRPGGAHILTVPYFPNDPTVELFDVVDGEFVLREPIRVHRDQAGNAIPTYHRFGGDFMRRIEAAGFSVEAVTSTDDDSRAHGIRDCVSFLAVAPG